MKKTKINLLFTGSAIALLAIGLSAGCKKSSPHIAVVSKGLQDFNQINLVANNATYNALRIDTLLQDAWGIAFSPAGNIWLSAEATGYSTIYDKQGMQILNPVAIPSPSTANNGKLTGIVFNGSTDFVLPNGAPAKFIFVTQDGVIAGWNPGHIVNAISMVNNSATAMYYGLALASNQGVNYLYAANFKAGTIDVFDNHWNKVNIIFTDPSLPANYSPFNIQKIDDKLYVMYAKVGYDGNEIHSAGLGIVDIFNTDGSFVKRFVSNGKLNSPWGITKAPASFFSSDSASITDAILIGNFGDGHINAYHADGSYIGALQSHGVALEINDLWALSFAPLTATSIDPNRLYFESGPNMEKDGLFGYINK